MTEASLIDIERDNGLLRERLNTIIAEINGFLAEVGAPSMTEASARYRRFAEIAVALPPKMSTLIEQAGFAKEVISKLEGKHSKSQEELKTQRTKTAECVTRIAVLSAEISAQHAALRLAGDIFDDPYFAAFRKETKGARDAIAQVMRNVPDNGVEDAKISS